MTVVRFKNRPNGITPFNNLLSDVFPQMPSLYRDDLKYSTPVNIKENEKEFTIDVVAPGMQKEDFRIGIEDNVLTVSAELQQQANTETQKPIRSEYKVSSFKRSFTIDEKMDADNIVAQYVNGILTLNIPKKKEVKPAAKQIIIN